jgi:Carbohydrate esterase, sialic acid-specific acetylesterase
MGRILSRNQPQSLILLDGSNVYADKFWLPRGNQFYAAHNDTILTRGAGSSAIKATTKGLALNGDGSTYFSVPSITLTAPYTISVMCSAPAASTAAMPIGDVTGTSNFLWVNDGTSARWRINGGDISFANSNFTTISVYTLVVDASNICSIYKDGVFLTSAFNGTPSFKITSIGTGYSSASFNLNGGVVVGVQVNSRRALSASEVKVISQDFWQPLSDSYPKDIGYWISGPRGVDVAATLGAVSVDGFGASILISTDVQGALGAIGVGGFNASVGTGTVTLTSPTTYQTYQRDGSNLATINIAGTYTGTPSLLEASYNGGAYTTIVASPSGGTFSGALTAQTAGQQGTLTVRFGNDHSTFGSVAYIGIGDIYEPIGQSNNLGHAFTAVQPSGAFVATEFDVSGHWKALTEFGGSTTNVASFSTRLNGVQCAAMNQNVVDGQGSYFGQLATNIMAASGMPVAFVPSAIGSTSVAEWLPSTVHTDPNSAYGSALTRFNSVGNIKAAIFYIGETNASGGTTTAAFEVDYNSIINSWFADTGTPVITCVINYAGGSYAPLANVQAIQTGILYEGRANPHAISGPNYDGLWTGNVHFGVSDTSSHDPIALANEAIKVLSANFYGGTVVNATNVGAVTTTGFFAEINPTVVSCALGAVGDAGFAADIGLATGVNCALGAVDVSGISASIGVATGILCSLAGVAVDGFGATILTATSISCSEGLISAAGNTASVEISVDVNCALSLVSFAGKFANIPVNLDIDCNLGSIVFAGFAAEITVQVAFIEGNINYFLVPPRSANQRGSGNATLEKRTFDNRLYDIVCCALLDADEFITDIFSISCDQTEFTFSAPVLNSGAVNYPNTVVAPPKTAIQLKIGGGEIPPGIPRFPCTIRAKIGTDIGNEIEADVVIVLRDQIAYW